MFLCQSRAENSLSGHTVQCHSRGRHSFCPVQAMTQILFHHQQQLQYERQSPISFHFTCGSSKLQSPPPPPSPSLFLFSSVDCSPVIIFVSIERKNSGDRNLFIDDNFFDRKFLPFLFLILFFDAFHEIYTWPRP